MANTSVSITPGSGANIAINAVGGLDMQVVKIDIGADGASLALVGDATYGIPCDVKRVSGVVVVNNPTAANLKVDASGATVPISAASAIPVAAIAGAPVFVRLSDGTTAVDTIPVTGTVAASQSGGWAMQITDGTHNAHLSLVSATYALDVNVVSSVAIGGTALADGATVTAGTTPGTPMAGVYNDAIASPSSGKAGLVRITANRGLHTNLRSAAGAEIGTAASPIFVSPATSPSNQPVTGTVTADQGAAGSAAWKADITSVGGVAISETAPVPMYQAKTPHARVSKTVALTNTTGGVVWMPTTSKKFFVKKLVLVVETGDTLDIYDATNATGSILASGTWPTGVFQLNFEDPFDSAAINNVLKYDGGASLAAVLTVHGWEE